MAGELYKKIVQQKDAPNAGPQKGDFVQWAYFHYGRFSYSTPGWWAPKFEIPKDTAEAKKYKANEDKNTDVDFLRWAEKGRIQYFHQLDQSQSSRFLRKECRSWWGSGHS